MTINDVSKRLIEGAILTCPGLERDYDIHMLEMVFASVLEGATEDMHQRKFQFECRSQ